MPLLFHRTVQFAALVTFATTLGPAAPATAQDTGPTSRPDTQTQQDKNVSDQKKAADAADGLLAGPKVKQQADSESRGPASMTRDRRDQQMPLTQWLRQLRNLDLTREQSRTIMPEVRDFQQKQRDFQQTHGEELRELRTQIRQAREDAQPNPKLREQAEKLQQMAPKAEELQATIWQHLTPAQQEQMRQRIDEWQKQREARMAARQRSDRATDQAMTDQAMTGDAMTEGEMDDADTAAERDGQTDRQRRLQRLRDRVREIDGDRTLSDLDANARQRLRFLRALQQRKRDRQ